MEHDIPLLIAVSLALSAALTAANPPVVSGIYPHLAMFNHEGECGTGAVVPWADRLWVVTYAPHKPNGSTDKLYEITPGLQQIIRPESIGGTPANRMIHRESNQLFIGPYAIAADRTVRAIPYAEMFGRLTGMARHLTDPANKILCATMEEGIYQIDVKSLAVTELWADEQRKAGRHSDLPGYHGKGFYSAQGRYDRKVLTVSHDQRESVTIRVEADFTGTGTWVEATALTVAPGKPMDYHFPDGFGAYWLRLVADRDATVTGTFCYD